jgi:hypothetical protein
MDSPVYDRGRRDTTSVWFQNKPRMSCEQQVNRFYSILADEIRCGRAGCSNAAGLKRKPGGNKTKP